MPSFETSFNGVYYCLEGALQIKKSFQRRWLDVELYLKLCRALSIKIQALLCWFMICVRLSLFTLNLIDVGMVIFLVCPVRLFFLSLLLGRCRYALLHTCPHHPIWVNKSHFRNDCSPQWYLDIINTHLLSQNVLSNASECVFWFWFCLYAVHKCYLISILFLIIGLLFLLGYYLSCFEFELCCCFTFCCFECLFCCLSFFYFCILCRLSGVRCT